MAFFDKIGDNITAKSRDLAKKAKEIAAVARLNSQIGSDEDSIKEIYCQIGKLCFEASSEDTEHPYNELFQNIKQAQLKILQNKKEIMKVKGTRQCSGCGAEMSWDKEFCGVCGAKNEIEPLEVVLELFNVCPKCGSEVLQDCLFCDKCGTKIQVLDKV